jgi:lipoate-protein ligase A
MPQEEQSTWYLFKDHAHSAAGNMATDETLLLSCATLAAPVLRFYSWSEPAASFGYFQRYAEVEQMTALRPLVRRPTGGGLVPHDADWTYSVVFSPGHAWYGLKATDSYERLHQWVQKAFEGCGVAANVALAANKLTPGQCFAGPEQFDVVWQGRKIAGAAQRRTRNGLLIQGSVQPPPTASREQWQNAMCDIAGKDWGVRWQAFQMTPELVEKMDKLETAKYRAAEYNRRR